MSQNVNDKENSIKHITLDNIKKGRQFKFGDRVFIKTKIENEDGEIVCLEMNKGKIVRLNKNIEVSQVSR